ncbi:UNVERIFIED_CONTAM: hypothetical protein FKN15_070655 [Acipenser sinensis]
MASNLSDSLTSMDWLPQLNLKGCVKSRSSELGAQTEKGARETNKPPFSYATLISQAIKSTARGRMSLNDIYSWICEQYPYYKNTAAGWKGSQDSLLEQEVTSSPSLGLQSESVRDERLWEGPPPSKTLLLTPAGRPVCLSRLPPCTPPPSPRIPLSSLPPPPPPLRRPPPLPRTVLPQRRALCRTTLPELHSSLQDMVSFTLT